MIVGSGDGGLGGVVTCDDASIIGRMGDSDRSALRSTADWRNLTANPAAIALDTDAAIPAGGTTTSSAPASSNNVQVCEPERTAERPTG